MIQELQFAIRRILKTPGFTASAVIILALGIGVNTVVFDIVHGLLFAPQAFQKPAELVQVLSQDTKNPEAYRGFSYPTYLDIRESNIFSGAMCFTLAMVGLGPQGDIHRVNAAVVSSNYFSVLGVPLVSGRGFLPEEELPGHSSPVAVVSYAYWQKHGLDPAVLGSRIFIDAHPFTVIGIAPARFTGTSQFFTVDVWVPLPNSDLTGRNDGPPTFGERNEQQLKVFGRMKPGVTATAVRPALEALAANLAKAYPADLQDQTFTTTPLSRISVGDHPKNDSGIAGLATLLQGMSAMVLLVACLNLTNMLLARGMARRKEISIRLVIGASRGRIVRQLLMEGFVLSLMAGAVALFLELWLWDLVGTSIRSPLPFDFAWLGGPDRTVLLATLVFCMAGTLMFALGPALILSRPEVVSALKEQRGEDTFRRRSRWMRASPLLITQIAFSLALLTAAGLFIRGAIKASSVETGLKPGASVVLETDSSLAGYDRHRGLELYAQLERTFAGLPGVEHTAISTTMPLGTVSVSQSVQRAGVHVPRGSRPANAAEGLAFQAAWNSVSADYFNTVGLPILRGRAFGEAESKREDGPLIAIIDDVLARKLWPNEDALGRYLQYATGDAPVADNNNSNIGLSDDGTGDVNPGEAIQIIGIASATRHALLEKNPVGQIYLPFARGFHSDVNYIVRFHNFASGSEAPSAELISRTLHDAEPALPILSIQGFQQHLDSNLQVWLARASATLFTVFGVLALALAVIGLYGVKAYSVVRRTREIGIRMALGAGSRDVLQMFLRESAVTLIVGIAIGILLAAGTGQLVRGMLYDVGPLDPVAFIAAGLLLGIAALAATWLPARRATHIDPLAALRME